MPPWSSALVLSVRRGLGDHHHPAQSEAIGDHAEARRPERLAERRLDASAVSEGVERPVGVRLCGNGERKPQPVELRLMSHPSDAISGTPRTRNEACMTFFSNPAWSIPGGGGVGLSS